MLHKPQPEVCNFQTVAMSRLESYKFDSLLLFPLMQPAIKTASSQSINRNGTRVIPVSTDAESRKPVAYFSELKL